MSEEQAGVKDDLEAAGQEDTGEVSDAADQTTEEAVESVPEKPVKTVPFAALDDERKKRQEYAQRLGQIERENEQYRNFFLEQQKQVTKKDEDNNDIIPTMGDIKKYIEDSFVKWQEQNKVSSIQSQYDDLQSRHDDFNDVWETAKQLVVENPVLEKIFMSEKNPVKAAYEYAKGHPNYSSFRETKKTKEVLKKVNNNLSRPGTLTDAGGMKSSSLSEAQKVWNMDPKDFDKFFDDLKKGKIKG